MASKHYTYSKPFSILRAVGQAASTNTRNNQTPAPNKKTSPQQVSTTWLEWLTVVFILENEKNYQININAISTGS
jgi:hypothetical protein